LKGYKYADNPARDVLVPEDDEPVAAMQRAVEIIELLGK